MLRSSIIQVIFNISKACEKIPLDISKGIFFNPDYALEILKITWIIDERSIMERRFIRIG